MVFHRLCQGVGLCQGPVLDCSSVEWSSSRQYEIIIYVLVEFASRPVRTNLNTSENSNISQWWSEFHKGKGYKNNQTHKEAFCRGCVQATVAEIYASELKAHSEGRCTVVRDESTIRKEDAQVGKPVCGRIEMMLRHLVKTCPHFENSTKCLDAERELEARTRKTKRGPVSNSTEIPRNPPLAPLQIPNAMPPPSHLPTPIASGACTPLPGLSGINTLVTFDTPISTPGPSVPPMLPLLQVDDVDMGPQAKRSNELQEQFRAELCMLLIATKLAWWAVDHPYVRATGGFHVGSPVLRFQAENSSLEKYWMT
ncbi:hypothetical protein QCA50_012609 [Cerrena zonata]|uniref:Uncharacterized protein n=1 Tax=Cerrena zonata TaxID=2478898 RepID=A0AAW0FSI7_9APHY